MPIDVTCPECDKTLHLRDEVAGKRVKCPKCGNKFVAKASSDQDNDTIAMMDDEPPAKAKKSRKRQRDDDDDDDDAPRKRPRKVDQVATPLAPMIWGILAILMPCPIVGSAIGLLAMGKASVELGNLPAGRKGDSARRNLKIAMGLGSVGLTISLILTVLTLIFGRG